MISEIFVRAGQRAVEESLPAFHAMGKAEALNVSIGEYHHGWCNKNREAMYAFFASNLGNSEASSEEWWPSGFGNLSALFDASQLQVTSTGQVRTVIRTIITGDLGCILPRVPAMIVRTGLWTRL